MNSKVTILYNSHYDYEHINGHSCLGRQFFMSTLGESNYLKSTKLRIFDNSRCQNRLVQNDDASAHPFDKDFVTLDGIHRKTNNTQLTKCIAFSAPPNCQQITGVAKKTNKQKSKSLLMDSSNWSSWHSEWYGFSPTQGSAANDFRWNFSGQVTKLHQNGQVCGLVFVDKGTCHPWFGKGSWMTPTRLRTTRNENL